MEKPIINPQIPYCEAIPGGLQQGKMVRIQGAALQHADRFSVNLQTGPSTKPRDDTALHISVRLKQGYIARNSYLGGSWGDEQGKGRLPIGPGQQFEIIILPDADDFKIAVNGQHFCEFPYRVPKDKITYLSIDGDVGITLISWEGVVPSAPQEGGDVARSAPSVQSASPGPGTPQGPPPGPGYGGPPQGFGGPPQGFGGPGQGFGPPPQGYGPPPQGYGPPPGGFGPQGGYGPPPPPGNEESSGFDHFMQSAQSMLSEAISSGAAEKLLGSILNPNQSQGFSPQNAQYGQYPGPQQQFQQRGPPQGQGQRDFNVPQYGGEGSVGGLGNVGSFLSSLAREVFSPQQPQGGQGQHGQRNQY